VVLNQVKLTATVIAIEPLRHTPAGLPVVDFTLLHESTQIESGSPRQIEIEVIAKVTGELANRVAQQRIGCQLEVHGFLNRKHRMSRQLVLHVTTMKAL